MKQFFLALGLLVSLTTLAQSTKKLEKIAGTITPEDIKSKLSVIASAEMEGRETATPGQKKAAAYIENYFKELGLQPGTPDGYQMQFAVYQDSVTSASFTVNANTLNLFTDFIPGPLSITTGNWNGDKIVFASFGIVDSSHNDFKNIDVKNKWVMVAEGKAEDADKPAGAV